MNERVSVVQGRKDSNIMVVAPHGIDDQYTIEITETLASLLDCHAVINKGFKRSNQTDTLNNLANCNNTDHCINDPVVYEEFAKPIIKFCQNQQANANQTKCYLFYIHGLNHKTGYDMIFGYGKGIKSNRYTMQPEKIQFLYDSLESKGYQCALGKAGGSYSARSRNNMAQLFRIDNWVSSCVESLQIEFSGSVRRNIDDAIDIATDICDTLRQITILSSYTPHGNLTYNEY